MFGMVDKEAYAESIRQTYHFGKGTAAIMSIERSDDESFGNVKRVLDADSTRKVMLKLVGRYERLQRRHLKEEGFEGEELKEKLYQGMAHETPGEAFQALIATGRSDPDYALEIIDVLRDEKFPVKYFFDYLNPAGDMSKEKLARRVERAKGDVSGNPLPLNEEEREKIKAAEEIAKFREGRGSVIDNSTRIDLEGLVKMLPIVFGGFLILGLAFLSPTFTGNVIGLSSGAVTSWVGGVFLGIGVVAGLVWMKKRQ